jgi:hypothetical protein
MKKKELEEEITRLNKKLKLQITRNKDLKNHNFNNDLGIIESIIKRYGDYEHELKREPSSSCIYPYDIDTHVFTLTIRK